MNCWQTLGIAPTGDEAAIKTAYAALIRQHRPDRDPAGFRRVRAAYEEALRLRPYYENRRDEPRRPTGWTPGKPPVAADDSDENSISQHDPSHPYPLAEPAAHDYRDTPPAAPEQPYPLSEPAAHDYQDGSAQPTFTPLEATVLLRQLQQAWQGQDDAQLLAILQSQAVEPALSSIDFRIDYIAALSTFFYTHRDHPLSYFWAHGQYQLGRNDSYEQQLADYLEDCEMDWWNSNSDADLCRLLQQQAAEAAHDIIAIHTAWRSRMAEFLHNSLTCPHSYYWARARYPEALPEPIPPVYKDYPDERITEFARALTETTDDDSLIALLENQAADPILAYPPARRDYLTKLVILRNDWHNRPSANHWLETHYTLPNLSFADKQRIYLKLLIADWQDADDAELLDILQAQACRPSLEHIDLRGDYAAALQAHLMQRHLPQSTLWADTHYQLGRHDPAWQQQRQLAYIAEGDHASFIASLDDAYPNLAAWLEKTPLRRYASLWRDWAATRIHPACRDWQRLRTALATSILAIPTYRSTWHRIRPVLFAAVLILIFLISSADIETVAPQEALRSIMMPVCLCVCIVFARLTWPNRPITCDPDRVLFNACPPLRILHDHCRLFPQASYWFATDTVIGVIMYRSANQLLPSFMPQHLVYTLGTLWLIGRIAQTLWQYKRAFAAGWRAISIEADGKEIYYIPTIICLITLYTSNPLVPWLHSLGLSAEAEMPGTRTLRIITLTLVAIIYLIYLLRIPLEESALRRALFDNGCLAVLISLTFAACYNESVAYIIALVMGPVTALTTTYYYRASQLAEDITQLFAHLATAIFYPLYASAWYFPLSTQIPHNAALLTALFLAGLTLYYCHPSVLFIKAILPNILYYLTRTLLYLFTAQAAMLIAVVLLGITGSAIPAAAFLALIVLHILASWKAA